MLQSSALHMENPVSASNDLHRGGSGIDVRFLSHAVSSCGSKPDLRGGVQYHCLTIMTGYIANCYVGSSLISLCGKSALLDNAYQAFEEMPMKNVVSWTAIIAGFAQDWQIDVCLELFHRMKSSMLKPNDFTYTSLLNACTGSAALGHGRSARCQIIHMGFIRTSTFLMLSSLCIANVGLFKMHFACFKRWIIKMLCLGTP
ncbi:Pentatricopeptide repeat-containing protein [Quillaja saponaria]|uniref:Pentatricopeptide repeat-containing protein n=1 Tax=Quillaja saponaria TaxID=32244 RepID=A0AAD7Q0B2_QUISA|nr:Pentatricopeptide repeat-containing protein [Quillaja saponaria]